MTILDLSCFDDLDELASEITDPLVALEQDNHHRIITPPGMNIDDPDFGLGIHRMLSGDEREVASLGPRIEAELLKDPRNAAVSATVLPLERGSYEITLRVVPDFEELGLPAGEDILTRYRASAAGLEVL